MRPSIPLTTALLLAVPLALSAQQLVPYEMTVGGDKGSKPMPLKLEMKDGKGVGYMCQQTALEALKPGDKTSLVVPARPDQVKLFDDVRRITVAAAQKEGETVTLTLKEPLKLGADRSVAKLVFGLNQGWYRLERAE